MGGRGRIRRPVRAGLLYRLRDQLPFAGPHVLVSVLSFDAGVEVAQLLVVVALAVAASRLMPTATTGRIGMVLLSAVIVHIAWHATIDRALALRDAGGLPPDGLSLLILARWVAGVGLAIGAAKYLVRRLDARAANASAHATARS